MEADDTGQTLREYIWLDDMPLAVVADVDTMSPNLYYVHADHLNTPVRMTDTSKSVVWDAFYLPFGAVASITGTAANNLRFPGQYFLIEDGLHYNWYRHYDSTVGRYVQADPLEFVNGPNIYAYAKSTPGIYSDPKGQQLWPWVAIGVGVVALNYWQWYQYNSHIDVPPPSPVPPPPSPKNACTVKYPLGTPGEEVRNWTPAPKILPQIIYPEPPELHPL